MYTLGELANRLGLEIVGDINCKILRVATLQSAGAGEVSFLSNKKYRQYLASSNADAVIVHRDDLALVKKNAIISANPYVSYAKIATLLHPFAEVKGQIAKSAVVHPTAIIDEDVFIGEHVYVGELVRIGTGCYVGHGCVIENGVTIGKNSRLYANVTIRYDCILGDRVMLHPGVVIGGDGFGLANDGGKWLKIPQIGKVCIGNDVEIGSNSTVDRGALGDTVLADGVKLDNLIQIGHNVTIGCNTAVAAATAIAGSTAIGSGCAIGGKVGIVGHLEIADNVQITGMSQVTQSINDPGIYSSGTPLELNKNWHRNYLRFKHLDSIAKQVNKLQKRFDKFTNTKS